MAEASSTLDPEFESLPTEWTFFLVWTLKDSKLVSLPKEQLGTFLPNQCYVIVCGDDGSRKVHAFSKRRPIRPEIPLQVYIHTWVGGRSSKEDSAHAFSKATQLKNHFGEQASVQVEHQGKESTQFVKYFPNGITLFEHCGTVGLSKVAKEKEVRLFQVKGRKAPVVVEKPVVNWSSMNSDDVFVLNCPKYVFLWIGKGANKMEKVQGAKVGQNLRTEGMGKCKEYVVVEEGSENMMSNAERRVFEMYLPLSEKETTIGQSEVSTDVQVEERLLDTLVLYRCSDATGDLKVTEEKRGALYQEDLDSTDAFIVDNGTEGVWVWIGKHASQEERQGAKKTAQELAIKNGSDTVCIKVNRVVDGGETIQFKSLFQNWKDAGDLSIKEKDVPGLDISSLNKLATLDLNVSELHVRPQIPPTPKMVDDASGTKRVYRTFNYDLIPVDEEEMGFFYRNNCYIVVYEKDPIVLIYHWIGSEATPASKGAAAMNTIRIDDSEFHGHAVHVRVNEGKESPHFAALFGGEMIICKKAFENLDNTECRMLQIRQTRKHISRAYEVEFASKWLNSNSVFLILTESELNLWIGQGCKRSEITTAERVAKRVSPMKPTLVKEGSEMNEFWTKLGGKTDYFKHLVPIGSSSSKIPRLFHCTNSKGFFTVKEIIDFQQGDLVESDPMILDAIHTVFVWIGSESNQEERQLALKTAEEYLKTDPNGRSEETGVIVVKQGHEPLSFTGYFGAWNPFLWRRSIRESDEIVNIQDICPDFRTCKKHSLEKLMVRDADDLPIGVNPRMKEMYLTEEEFYQVFQMPFAEYESLPDWRKIILKREVGLI